MSTSAWTAWLDHGQIIGPSHGVVKCRHRAGCRCPVRRDACDLRTHVASCGSALRGEVVTMRDRAERFVALVPPAARRMVLHRMGRFAPWEPQFNFTPPPLGPGEHAGPPDFVGIGVQKAGTTWWYDRIAGHPSVASPSAAHKERHFFDRFGAQPFGPHDVEQYHGWFPRRPGQIAGEWTPDYFTYDWTPQLLRRAAPDARLLLLLRDPVDRLKSGLAHRRRMGESVDGAGVADAVQRGFYHRALVTWLDYFDKDRFLILQYERCVADPSGQLEATFRFLGIPDSSGTIVNQEPTSPSDQREPFDPELTQRLVGLYEADVRALGERLPMLDLRLWPNFAHLAGPIDHSGTENSPTRRP